MTAGRGRAQPLDIRWIYAILHAREYERKSTALPPAEAIDGASTAEDSDIRRKRSESVIEARTGVHDTYHPGMQIKARRDRRRKHNG